MMRSVLLKHPLKQGVWIETIAAVSVLFKIYPPVGIGTYWNML